MWRRGRLRSRRVDGWRVVVVVVVYLFLLVLLRSGGSGPTAELEVVSDGWVGWVAVVLAVLVLELSVARECLLWVEVFAGSACSEQG